MWGNIRLQRVSCYLRSLLSSTKVESHFPLYICQMSVNAANKKVERLRRVPFPSLLRQKFNLFADMCSSGTDRSSTTSVLSSPFPHTVSNCAFLFILVFCQVVKPFTAHFVLHFVFLGTVSDNKAISSSLVFGERKRPVAIMASTHGSPVHD